MRSGFKMNDSTVSRYNKRYVSWYHVRVTGSCRVQMSALIWMTMRRNRYSKTIKKTCTNYSASYFHLKQLWKCMRVKARHVAWRAVWRRRVISNFDAVSHFCRLQFPCCGFNWAQRWHCRRLDKSNWRLLYREVRQILSPFLNGFWIFPTGEIFIWMSRPKYCIHKSEKRKDHMALLTWQTPGAKSFMSRMPR